MTFRHEFKRLREQAGLTVPDLAVRTDLTEKHLADIELGLDVPSRYALGEIEKCFVQCGIRESDLMKLRDAEPVRQAQLAVAHAPQATSDAPFRLYFVVVTVLSIWCLSALYNFAVLHLSLAGVPAVLWAVVVLVVTFVCVGTLVGIAVWPYAIGFVSIFFGSPPPQWAGANMVTLFWALGTAFVVGGVVGSLAVVVMEWTISLKKSWRQRGAAS